MIEALGATPHRSRRRPSALMEARISAMLEIVKVAMGIVKWFNPEKGYGFIRPNDGSVDVFVHISAVQKAGHTTLAEGARVSYELLPGRSGKMSAENLRIG